MPAGAGTMLRRFRVTDRANGRTMVRTKPPRRFTSLVRVSVVAMASALAASSLGCRVSDSDVRRWGTTEHGPDKLAAVIAHDKYDWSLRVAAGLELLGMKP